MGTKYSSQSSSGYNASPPSDDGAATSSNKVQWSTIKTKLSDVLKTFIESVNSGLVTALNTSARAVTANDTAAATDHWRTIQVNTASVTVTLSDAATMAAGYMVAVANQSSGDISVALASAGDTIDGVTNVTKTISSKETRVYLVNSASNGYVTYGYGNAQSPLPRSYLSGGTLSNNGVDAVNDIDVTAGEARDSTNAINIKWSALTGKQLDAAWAAGSSAGMLDTGAIANGTYHIYAIRKDSNGTADILASTSASSPTMPSGYTYFRRIGSILRESASIVAFTQDGDTFQRNALAADVSSANPGTSAVTRTLSVPTGVRVEAVVHATLTVGTNSNSTGFILSDLSVSDEAPANTGPSNGSSSNITTNPLHIGAGGIRVFTNTSGQIRSRLATSDANHTLRVWTRGWVDRRSRDA